MKFKLTERVGDSEVLYEIEDDWENIAELLGYLGFCEQFVVEEAPITFNIANLQGE